MSAMIDPAREYLFATKPDDPEMRESVNVWVWDEGDAFGMPRFGVEAVADQWDTHDVQLNLALRDGRRPEHRDELGATDVGRRHSGPV
jgi:hypothetical protein